MPFGLCNALATFQWLMQNCLGELNLIYCLIYLDDLILLSRTVKENVHWLHVVFDWLREHNLKLKPLKCSLFKEEINYLAHWVSKWGVWPSDTNLKAIAECAPPQTYMEIWAFFGLMKVRVAVTFWKPPGGFPSIKMSLHEQSCSGFHWLYEGLFTQNGCFLGGIGSGALPEPSRLAFSSSSLCQLSTNSPWKELSLHQIGVSGIKMGHPGSF